MDLPFLGPPGPFQLDRVGPANHILMFGWANRGLIMFVENLNSNIMQLLHVTYALMFVENLSLQYHATVTLVLTSNAFVALNDVR
jgi:hypothetical protein